MKAIISTTFFLFLTLPVMQGQMVGGARDVASEEVDEVLIKLKQNIHRLEGEDLK